MMTVLPIKPPSVIANVLAAVLNANEFDRWFGLRFNNNGGAKNIYKGCYGVSYRFRSRAFAGGDLKFEN
jgi:hypothetical protein